VSKVGSNENEEHEQDATDFSPADEAEEENKDEEEATDFSPAEEEKEDE
jgi:hypothetical protein